MGIFFAVAFFTQDESIKQLCERLGDETPAVRDQAEKDLIKLGAKARPAIEKELKGHTEPEVATRGKRILDLLRIHEILGDEEAEEFMQRPSARGKLGALIRNAKSLHDEKVTEKDDRLIAENVLKSPATPVDKTLMTEQIDKHKLRLGAWLLVEWMGDEDASVSSYACAALPGLEVRAILPRVASYLKHDNKHTRMGAISVLSQMNASEYLKELGPFLSDSDVDMCAHVITWLNWSKFTEHDEKVSTFLRHENARLRHVAAECLYDHDDVRLFDHNRADLIRGRCLELVELIRGGDEQNRAKAMAELEHLGPIVLDCARSLAGKNQQAQEELTPVLGRLEKYRTLVSAEINKHIDESPKTSEGELLEALKKHPAWGIALLKEKIEKEPGSERLKTVYSSLIRMEERRLYFEQVNRAALRIRGSFWKKEFKLPWMAARPAFKPLEVYQTHYASQFEIGDHLETHNGEEFEKFKPLGAFGGGKNMLTQEVLDALKKNDGIAQVDVAEQGGGYAVMPRGRAIFIALPAKKGEKEWTEYVIVSLHYGYVTHDK